MRDQFVFHIEQYPIAESVGANVDEVLREDTTFTVVTEDGNKFKGNAVVFCTGKEYRRLGAPDEEKFLGRGIAFCATCDAPLYRGKRVAVVGSGNSALTAVRDLINFAAEIHLVHRRNIFTADASLIKEVKSVKKVKFHTNTEIQEFLGDDRLRGVRLKSIEGKKTEDLKIDGVFLEIGLTPNTESIEDLIELNERGEIPVKADSSTTITGFSQPAM